MWHTRNTTDSRVPQVLARCLYTNTRILKCGIHETLQTHGSPKCLLGFYTLTNTRILKCGIHETLQTHATRHIGRSSSQASSRHSVDGWLPLIRKMRVQKQSKLVAGNKRTATRTFASKIATETAFIHFGAIISDDADFSGRAV